MTSSASGKEIEKEKPRLVEKLRLVLCGVPIEFETLDKTFVGVAYCNRAVQHNGPHRINIPSVEDLELIAEEENEV